MLDQGSSQRPEMTLAELLTQDQGKLGSQDIINTPIGITMKTSPRAITMSFGSDNTISRVI
jgi:hypothetical protein